MRTNLKVLQLLQAKTGLPVKFSSHRLMVGGQEASAFHLFADHGQLEIGDFQHFEEGEFKIPVMLFISRHIPTPEQYSKARDVGYLLLHVGDMNPFQGMGEFLVQLQEIAYPFESPAIATVHPAIACLALASGFDVAVFEAERLEPGETRKEYRPINLHIYEGVVHTPRYIMEALEGAR